MIFIPYRPEHLAKIALQPAQRAARAVMVKDGYAESLAVPGMAWTAVNDAGEILGSAGMVPQWEGRVIAWALVGILIPKRSWPIIAKKIEGEFQSALAEHGRHRIEITVPVNFGAGCRLARLLGFDIEGRLRAYAPDGSDHFLYAKIVGGNPCAQ